LSYIIEVERKIGSGTEKKIDLPRFAADLAKELGAKVLPPATDYPSEYQSLAIGIDRLVLNADNWKKRVTANLEAPDVAWGDWSTYADDQKTESATVNPDGRSIASIAKDIQKRVIDANQAALAARRAYAVQQKQNRADIVARAAALKAAHPNLDVRVNESEQSATIYSGPSAFYLNARMNSSGRVSIDRLGDVSGETFGKILAVLEAGAK
jgi:hypothetical protein